MEPLMWGLMEDPWVVGCEFLGGRLGSRERIGIKEGSLTSLLQDAVTCLLPSLLSALQ